MYSNTNYPSCFYQVDQIIEGEVFGLSASYNHHVDNNINAKPKDEAKATAASNSHKEAERRRRKRINDHISTLKSILPNTIKTDKASLLGEAVRRVRELEKTVAELYGTNEEYMFPSETDYLQVCRQCEDNHIDSGLIKATLCCEDRPGLILDLVRALELAAAKVVRTEMSTVGGRTKTVMWVDRLGDADGGLERLRRALKTVVDNSILFVGSGPGNERARWHRL